MPAETINIRYDVGTETNVTLAHQFDSDGYLESGYIHFPPGCQALVYVRVSVEVQGSMFHICPVEDKETNTPQYVALDNFTFPFPIDREVKRRDILQVEIYNYDDTQDHQITVLIYRWDKKPEVVRLS